MKKVVLIVVLVMVLAATMLGGCGSQGGAQAEPEVAEPEVIKVKITADGKTNEVEVAAATVEEVLTEAGVTLGADDIVSPRQSYTVSDGQEIKITRVTFGDDEQTEEVPYETEYVPDNTMYEGNSYYVQEGITGEVVNKYKVTYHNGEEVHRDLVSSEEKVAVQNEVIAYGTVVYVAPASSGGGGGGGNVCVPEDDDSTW